jgi:hypothetical protein
MNKIIVKNQYPILWIDDLLDQLKGSKSFIKIDLKSGYHQLTIQSTDVWKKRFKTKEGLFEWFVMVFGLTDAPTTFMRMMDVLEILHTYTLTFSLVLAYNIPLQNRALPKN